MREKGKKSVQKIQVDLPFVVTQKSIKRGFLCLCERHEDVFDLESRDTDVTKTFMTGFELHKKGKAIPNGDKTQITQSVTFAKELTFLS